jgi:hypothetical protein
MNEDHFNSPGIDYDIDNHLVPQLNADHRYLHIGYVRLKQGKKWGEWTFARLARYHARIVDAIRETGRPYPPPSKGGLKLELDKASEEFEKKPPQQGGTETKTR